MKPTQEQYDEYARKRNGYARKIAAKINREELQTAIKWRNKQAVNCYRKAVLATLHTLGINDDMCAAVDDEFRKRYSIA